MRCQLHTLIGITLLLVSMSLFATMLLVPGQVQFSIIDQLSKSKVKIRSTFTPLNTSMTLNDGVYTYHLNLSHFQSEFPYLQNYQCTLILTPLTVPKEMDIYPLLILAIKSHPSSGHRREVLRRTWAKEGIVDGYRVKPIFLLGLTEVRGHMEIIRVESKEFGDILQWDIKEGHHNLSLKERCFLEWLHYKVPKITFIFKGDDDEFVNPTSIVQYIKEHGSSPQTLHGALQRHSVVLRYSKYQISKALFPNHKYPFFLSGGGFLFPGTSVKLLYEMSRKLPVFPLDDVYFGFLALAANLTYRHDNRFHVFGLKYDVCSFQRALVVHKIKMETLVEIWAEVQRASCKDLKINQMT